MNSTAPGTATTTTTTMLSFIQRILSTSEIPSTKRKRGAASSDSEVNLEIGDQANIINEAEGIAATIDGREEAVSKDLQTAKGDGGEEERRRKRRRGDNLWMVRQGRLSANVEGIGREDGKEEEGSKMEGGCGDIEMQGESMDVDVELERTDSGRITSEELWTWKGGSSLLR